MTGTRELVAAILSDPSDPFLHREVQAYLFGTAEGVAMVRDACEGDLHAAIRLVGKALPGWQYLVGRTCDRDWVTLMPDWSNSLHRPRLEWELSSAADACHRIEVPVSPPNGRYPALVLVIAVIKAVAQTRRCMNKGRIARQRQLREERKAKSLPSQPPSQ